MKHSVVFNNTDNHWDNALPIGNGCFGAMVYYEGDALYIPMNHYEVYYNIKEAVLPDDKLKAYKDADEPGAEHKERLRIAIGNTPPEGEPFACYRSERETAFDKESVCGNLIGSYPKTGDIKIGFSDSLSGGEHKLSLRTEDAKVYLELKNKGDNINVETLTAREDCLINHITQSSENLIKYFELELAPQRGNDLPSVSWRNESDNTFVYTVSRILGKKTFVFSGVVKLVGASAELEKTKYGARLSIRKSKNDFYILTGIFTSFRHADTEKEGIEKTSAFADKISDMYLTHKAYWDSFFNRSSISIPDKFLEHIYFVNQYALDCCSGKDGVMRHHACGLNGLWDVRHPSLWGSMWYWDVNIQAAFAGVFSSNRLDLAKVFSDGLLSYVDLAKKSAKNVHNASGIAGDYPYSFYYSCWPWCAQYLWYLYEYSLDKEYLQNDAYPVFLGLSEFFCDIFKYDEARGYYSVYPDVSPEQGPLTHDSVISVSCVKYLFKFTLEAAKILGRDDEILSKCREIMNNMAPYPTSKDGSFGVHFNDSYDAPDNMWIRHPSMLMPLFPIGEFDLTSDKEILKILSNTVDYLDERAEIGIFGGSWIAAAAARLGRGQTAIRLLYERGIDHMLRTNGLTAEETDRFINYCLIPRQPLYYPCMMEFTGEMLAAVNEMLIQSNGGIIRIFPAIPDGDPEYERLLRRGSPINEFIDKYNTYDAWSDVSFEKLLCKGAFEVSASLENRKLKFIKIYSKKGGKINITSPFMDGTEKVFSDSKQIAFNKTDAVISFDTEEGKTYIIGENADVSVSEIGGAYTDAVLSHTTYTKRNIYIGENDESKYQTAVDSFIRDRYIGNVRVPNHTMYKFDFTNDKDKKYSPCLARQSYTAEERMLKAMGFFPIGDENMQFTTFAGYGFSDASGICIEDSASPDALRRDGAVGECECEFLIEAQRGQYELLVVSGDDKSDTVTLLEGVNGIKAGGEVIKKGHSQCKIIPIVNETDEPIRLKISTKQGYKWKINYIMLNRIRRL